MASVLMLLLVIHSRIVRVCSPGAGLQRLHGLRPAVVHGEERPRLRHHVQPPADDHGGPAQSFSRPF
jgi:hypothetical protein